MDKQSHVALVLKVAQAISDRQYPTQMDLKDARAAIAAVHEALREPSDEMVEAICAAHTRCRWPEDFDKHAQALRRDDAIIGWIDALAASPIVQEE